MFQQAQDTLLKAAQQQQNERNAKMYENAAMSGDTCGKAEGRTQSQLEQAQNRLHNSAGDAQRASRAVTFFTEHPEFDEFIQLVRAGVIQI